MAVLKEAEAIAKRTKQSKNSVLRDALQTILPHAHKTKSDWYMKYVGTMSEEDAQIVVEASKAARELHEKDYL